MRHLTIFVYDFAYAVEISVSGVEWFPYDRLTAELLVTNLAKDSRRQQARHDCWY